MRKIRVAVIGCGVIGPLHVECFSAMEEVKITWLCDLIPERAEQLARKRGIARWTANAAEVFAASDVDMVSICTDHGSHSALVVAALENGKDVLCEKPLAESEGSLRKMLAAAKRHNDRICGGVFQHRFDPIYDELHGIIASNSLGTMLNASASLRCIRTDSYYREAPWRGTLKHEGGSVLINQAIHYIDQLVWNLGGFKSVAANVANLAHAGVIETEDAAAAALSFKCGAVGTVEATSASNLNWRSRLAFYGTKGSIEIQDDKLAFVDFADREIGDSIRTRLEAAVAPNTAMKTGKKYYGSGHHAQIADFVASVKNRTAPTVTLESAAETVRSVFAIYKAAKAGRPQNRIRRTGAGSASR